MDPESLAKAIARLIDNTLPEADRAGKIIGIAVMDAETRDAVSICNGLEADELFREILGGEAYERSDLDLGT